MSPADDKLNSQWLSNYTQTFSNNCLNRKTYPNGFKKVHVDNDDHCDFMPVFVSFVLPKTVIVAFQMQFKAFYPFAFAAWTTNYVTIRDYIDRKNVLSSIYHSTNTQTFIIFFACPYKHRGIVVTKMLLLFVTRCEQYFTFYAFTNL